MKAAGATALRGGAFKPRTSPYAFQGMKEDGLKLLALAREQTGLAVVNGSDVHRGCPVSSRICRCAANWREKHAELPLS